MEMQTIVFEVKANQNHNNSDRSSSTSHVSNNTTKDTQPIHESYSVKSHRLKQQQKQHQTEDSFSEEEPLPWEEVTTKR